MNANPPHVEFENASKSEKHYRVVKRVLFTAQGERNTYDVQYWSWFHWGDIGISRSSADEAVGWVKTQCHKSLPFVEDVIWSGGYYLPVNGGNGNI